MRLAFLGHLVYRSSFIWDGHDEATAYSRAAKSSAFCVQIPPRRISLQSQAISLTRHNQASLLAGMRCCKLIKECGRHEVLVRKIGALLRTGGVERGCLLL